MVSDSELNVVESSMSSIRSVSSSIQTPNTPVTYAFKNHASSHPSCHIPNASHPASHSHRISNSDDTATTTAPPQPSQPSPHLLPTTDSLSPRHRPSFEPPHFSPNDIPSGKTDSTEQHHNPRAHNPCHKRRRDLLLPAGAVGSPFLASRISVAPVFGC